MRKQTDYNEIIGMIDGEYYMLDYIFDDGKDFKGATGSVFSPVSPEEQEDLLDIDNIKDTFADCWREAVSGGHTEDSLDDYCQSIIDNDGIDGVIDTSYSNYWDKIRQLDKKFTDDWVFNCTGGGRCFSKNMKFDKVFRQDLIDIINKYEI